MMQKTLTKISQKIYIVALILLANVGFSSCFGDELEPMKEAHGRIDNILVVAQPQLWNSEVGDSFKVYFEGLFPITPQPESLYDLRYLQFNEFDKYQKLHRTILFLADLSDESSETTQLVRKVLGEEGLKRAASDPQYRIAVHQDRWAKGQLVIYWFAPDRKALTESVVLHYKNVMQNIQKHDDKKLTEMLYNLGMNQEAGAAIKQQFKVDMSIPSDYQLAVQDSNAIWLRFETNKISSNIFVYSLPEGTVLSPDNLRATRNRITQKYFTTEVDSSYMQIDDRFLPVFYQSMQFAQSNALQARGIWAMVNDFMGGSFITYLIEDKKNKRVLLLDAFIHAPGQQKRIELRRLDLILSTLKI
jgi:hypothetical protein